MKRTHQTLNKNDVFKVAGSLGIAEVAALQRFQTTSDLSCCVPVPSSAVHTYTANNPAGYIYVTITHQ